MDSPVDPKQAIKFRLQVQEILQGYLDREAWTPLEGAMLLSGLCPPPNVSGLPEIGKEEPIGGIRYPDYSPIHEARNTLRKWQEWCEAYNEARAEDDAYLYADEAPFVIEKGTQPEIPDQFKPAWFIHWFLANEVQHSWPEAYEYPWAEPFAELSGLSRSVGRVSFAVANYADRISTALDVMLGALDDDAVAKLRAAAANSPEPEPKAPPASPSSSTSSATTVQSRTPLYAQHRGYLTTEEFAAMLGVEPQTILKNHSQNGHYGDVRPTKLPSRRLAWPLDAFEQVMANGKSN
jgi:hypothetical protein